MLNSVLPFPRCLIVAPLGCLKCAIATRETVRAWFNWFGANCNRPAHLPDSAGFGASAIVPIGRGDFNQLPIPAEVAERVETAIASTVGLARSSGGGLLVAVGPQPRLDCRLEDVLQRIGFDAGQLAFE